MFNVKKLFSKSGTAEKKTELVKIENIEEPAEVANSSTEDEGELIAAISAALAAFMGSNSKLIVRSINRVEGNTPEWAKIGRQEQMFNRL